MNYKPIPSPLLNEDTFIVISQRKYKYTSFFFLLKKRGSYCPLLIYRTLTLVTFFWIGNLLLLKEGWKDLWIRLRTFLSELSACTFVSQEILRLFFFSFVRQKIVLEHQVLLYCMWFNIYVKFYKIFIESK